MRTLFAIGVPDLESLLPKKPYCLQRLYNGVIKNKKQENLLTVGDIAQIIPICEIEMIRNSHK
jgi:hypothetical protein